MRMGASDASALVLLESGDSGVLLMFIFNILYKHHITYYKIRLNW